MKKLIIICFAFIISSILLLKQNVYADNNDINIELYNETNTYDVDVNNSSSNSIKYDLNEKNYNIVSDKQPQITFLIHGLAGSAGDWCNSLNSNKKDINEYEKEFNDKFNGLNGFDYYHDDFHIDLSRYINEDDSLIGALAQKSTSNIYVAKVALNGLE